MDKKNKNKKIISLGIILFLVMLLVSGGSYAFWTWITAVDERTNVTLTIEAPDMSATFTGYTQNVSNLIPVTSCTDETYAIKKQVNLTYENLSANAGEILGTLSVQNFVGPNGTPSVTALSHLHYAVTTSDDNCTSNPVSGMSGVFKATSGNLFTGAKLMNVIPSGTTETSVTFYVWVWLDSEYSHQNVGSGVVSDPMQNISFDLVWSGEVKNDLIAPNAPILDDGMIPVKIANNGTVTTVSSDDEDWYDYSNKEWANVVLVKESGTRARSYYKNNIGVTVNQSDILAYYVWIPRYKYKIWDTTGTSSPQSINIEFESKTTEPVLGTTVGSWRTHPAFIWDGDAISGIWVGKFETSVDSSSLCNSTPNPTNCNNSDLFVKILPNVSSLRYQDLSVQFVTSLKFSGGAMDDSTGETTFVGSSTYGLTENTDSHVMKNSEWGAVLYLSHSQYGINNNIRKNNYYYRNTSTGIVTYKTGCGALEETSVEKNKCEIAYGGATSYPQSTTGNISGVFDMAGGVVEYVMGNYNDNKNGSNFTVLPESKYYDKYTNYIILTACDSGTCYGHALSETNKWYSGKVASLVSYYWLYRGNAANAWSYTNSDGFRYGHVGFRVSEIVFEE